MSPSPSNEQIPQPGSEDNPSQKCKPQQEIEHTPCKYAPHALFWSIAVAGTALDLITKSIVFSYLEAGKADTFSIIPGLLNLTMHTNTGGPFSILRGNAGWLAAITAVELIVIFYLYLSFARKGQRLLVAALGIVTAGAVGNFYDRMTLGHVRDFVQVWIGNWPYPTFNVADSLICVGAGLIVISLLRKN